MHLTHLTCATLASLAVGATTLAPQRGIESAPPVRGALPAIETLARPARADLHSSMALTGLPPAHQAVVNRYTALVVDSYDRYDANSAVIDAISDMTASLTDDAIEATCDSIRFNSSVPASDAQLLIAVVGTDTFGIDIEENVYAVTAVDLHESSRSGAELCAESPEACEIVQLTDDFFPDFRQGTFSALIGSDLTVGVYSQVTVGGVLGTLLIPWYVVPANAPLSGWQYAEMLLLHKDELLPVELGAELDFLFPGGTDSAQGSLETGDCLTQDVVDCITQRLGEFMAKLADLEKDYKKKYNRILERAQRNAERYSPIHSLEGLWNFIIRAGIGAVFQVVKIWEDFASDVADLNEDYLKDVCDAHKEFRNKIIDCLEDCPLEIRLAMQAQMNAALAAMGCN